MAWMLVVYYWAVDMSQNGIYNSYLLTIRPTASRVCCYQLLSHIPKYKHVEKILGSWRSTSIGVCKFAINNLSVEKINTAPK